MKKGTCRLYDKDFNLLALWMSDEKLYFVQDDELGGRKSGLVTAINFTEDR